MNNIYKTYNLYEWNTGKLIRSGNFRSIERAYKKLDEIGFFLDNNCTYELKSENEIKIFHLDDNGDFKNGPTETDADYLLSAEEPDENYIPNDRADAYISFFTKIHEEKLPF